MKPSDVPFLIGLNIVLFILSMCCMIYLKFHDAEFIFDKKQNEFLKRRVDFGVKRQFSFKLKDIHKLRCQSSVYGGYGIQIVLAKNKKVNFYGTYDHETILELSKIIGDFLEVKIEYPDKHGRKPWYS